MKFTSQLMMLVVIVTLALGGSFILLSYFSIKDRFIETQTEWIGTVANALSEGLAMDLDNGHAERSRLQLQTAVFNDEAFEYAYIVNNDGKVFSHSFDEGMPSYVTDSLQLKGNHRSDVYELDTPDGEIQHFIYRLQPQHKAALHIGVLQAEVDALMDGTMRDIGWALLVVCLLGFLIASFVGRSLGRQLDEFSKMMAVYGREGRSVPPSSDIQTEEIQHLVAAFEQMVRDREHPEDHIVQ